MGDNRSLRVDVRVLAATNRDLRERCWREFPRRSVPPSERVPLTVPPLRERGEDVVLLAGFSANSVGSKIGLSRVVLSPVRGRTC
ncbi:hypothetical protein ACVXG7_14510 [Enterobacter hormaechei]